MDDLHDPVLAARVQALLDNKTKPRGSLGRIEQLALQLALVLGSPAPVLREPQLVVFAGDHGLARHGVSAYPSDVTWQMVENFLAGGAAVSVLARQHGLALTVVDCGVAHTFEPRAGLLDCKIAPGTADALAGPAMTREQCGRAVAAGRGVVARLPGNALLLGEMGIGNTSAAALLLARLAGEPLDRCVGAGTGLDAAGVARKRALLQRVLDLHAGAVEPLDALAAFGGFEIAALVGAVLEAAQGRRVVVVDGFITGAAVLVASRLEPHVLQRCVFAHASAESGHRLLLQRLHSPVAPALAGHASAAPDAAMGVSGPLLDLGLRLGEASGAALAWPLLVSACALLRDMASFAQAGVSGPDPV